MSTVSTFTEIEAEFIERAYAVVWCNGATIDAQQRPRSRVLHPIWEGTTGWITTKRDSPKVRQLAANPHLSLAYVAEPFKPFYVECQATWEDDLATKQRIWELCQSLPEPMGFDPALIWGDVAAPDHGLLRLTAWRIELNDFSGPPRTTIWRREG